MTCIFRIFSKKKQQILNIVYLLGHFVIVRHLFSKRKFRKKIFFNHLISKNLKRDLQTAKPTADMKKIDYAILQKCHSTTNYVNLYDDTQTGKFL